MKGVLNYVLVLAVCSADSSLAFVPSSTFTRSERSIESTDSSILFAKGFGEPKNKREKSAGEIDRQQKSEKYDDIANTGGQEYRIFVRKFGSDDQSWLPAGAIAVPRGAQVSDAIFANEDGLKASIVKAMPKLRGQEGEFEYGYNLKVYPDDPVEVAVKGGAKTAGPSIGNWISNVLSPVDASQVKPQQ